MSRVGSAGRAVPASAPSSAMLLQGGVKLRSGCHEALPGLRVPASGPYQTQTDWCMQSTRGLLSVSSVCDLKGEKG